jgi:23S rRNA pseudouridine955/2504/2580 synthase/23S rRNA pseudouridine1911/1915/1917 synthase
MTAPRRRTVAAEPGELGELARRLGDAPAVREGRVFVGGRRELDPGKALEGGELVDVYAARPNEEPARVLAEVAGVVVAFKPSAMATEPDRQGAAGSLVHEIARQLGLAPNALHAVSRLDVGVSGAVVLARRGAAPPAELARRYVAIAERGPEPECGRWSSPVRTRGRDLAAHTRFALVARAGAGAALLVLEPETGRTHQIRVHASRAGVPLLGDRAHGGSPRVVLASGRVLAVERVALHAIRVRGSGLDVVAPVPEPLVALWSALGGHARDFERALESELAP